MRKEILKHVITAPLYKFAGDIRVHVGECRVDVSTETVLLVTIDEVQTRLFRKVSARVLEPAFKMEFDVTRNPSSGIIEVDIIEMTQENPPAVPDPCEHHWVSMHEGDHLLYWVKICSQCGRPDWDDLDNQIRELLKNKEKNMEAGEDLLESSGTITKPVANPHDFQMRAKDLVLAYVRAHLDKTDDTSAFGLSDVYVVWFCKTLQNWKALVITTLPDGMYYEVTHDSVACYDYVDAYKKFENVAVPEGVDPAEFF